MDDHLSEIKIGEQLPAGGLVYRLVVATFRDRKNKKIPAVRCFTLSESDENKLSVEWEEKTTPEESVARVGASYKKDKSEYKPHDNREIYALEIDFLNSLEVVNSTVYDPIYFEKSQPGCVNNPAHSLVVFSEDFLTKDRALQPEIYLKMRDHAQTRKVEIDMNKVELLVREYRRQGLS